MRYGLGDKFKFIHSIIHLTYVIFYCVLSDKLRKGKRDGTPDKPTTPITSQDALMEEGTPQPDAAVIINDEILGLQIKPEDLAKVGYLVIYVN